MYDVRCFRLISLKWGVFKLVMFSFGRNYTMILRSILVAGALLLGIESVAFSNSNAIESAGVSVRSVGNEIREANANELGNPNNPPVDNDIWSIRFRLDNANNYPMVCNLVRIEATSARKGYCSNYALQQDHFYTLPDQHGVARKSSLVVKDAGKLDVYHEYCAPPKVTDLRCSRGCIDNHVERHGGICRRLACTMGRTNYAVGDVIDEYNAGACTITIRTCQENGTWKIDTRFEQGVSHCL